MQACSLHKFPSYQWTPYFVYEFADEYFIMPKTWMFLVCQGGLGVLSQLERLTGIPNETSPLDFSFISTPLQNIQKDKDIWEVIHVNLLQMSKDFIIQPIQWTLISWYRFEFTSFFLSYDLPSFLLSIVPLVLVFCSLFFFFGLNMSQIVPSWL